MSYTPSFDDRSDYRDAERGFLGALTPGVVKNADGEVVWDIDAYSFVQKECPPTVHKHLWRQAQLNTKQGLFEVKPGIYQVRALDLSNMTIVEGKRGIIVIDPLISCETASAALGLYRSHRGKDRPVTGLIYSHPHGDHYMGAGGIIPAGEDASIPILAPDGFIEAAMSENVLAGPAMMKRAAFMYGTAIPCGPRGQLGVGLGMATSTGSTSFILPNILIKETGEERVVDGVRIVFQMVPGTEAPAEMNFHFPDFKAFCSAETATNCLHNIVTLRGAEVRDARAWSRYLDEAIELFARDSDVVFGSHNWPTWGQEELITRLSQQRDLYGFLHDQTVRMMNQGMTGIEIAEKLQLPPGISRAWHCRGLYGSVNHNVKGIYQKYMTWFDGNPAHLWLYPPAEEGRRYVEALGGVDALCDRAEEFISKGDNRFAATLLGHAVVANEDSSGSRARLLLSGAYEQLGFGAENAPWRNFYLTGAQELRTGNKVGMVSSWTAPLGMNMSVSQWFDVLSVRVDGERAAEASFMIDIDVTDAKQKWRLIVSNGVLTPRLLRPDLQRHSAEGRADLELGLTRAELLDVLLGKRADAGKQEGRTDVLHHFLDLVTVRGSA